MQRDSSKEEDVIRHVDGLIRAAPIIIVVALGVFVISLSRVPYSLLFWLSTTVVGCLWFALVWRHWRRPTSASFAVLIPGVVLPGFVLADCLLGRERHLSFWATAQYLSLVFSVVLTLVLIFQRRLRSSLLEMRATSN